MLTDNNLLKDNSATKGNDASIWIVYPKVNPANSVQFYSKKTATTYLKMVNYRAGHFAIHNCLASEHASWLLHKILSILLTPT